jgi:hypothetical protein
VKNIPEYIGLLSYINAVLVRADVTADVLPTALICSTLTIEPMHSSETSHPRKISSFCAFSLAIMLKLRCAWHSVEQELRSTSSCRHHTPFWSLPPSKNRFLPWISANKSKFVCRCYCSLRFLYISLFLTGFVAQAGWRLRAWHPTWPFVQSTHTVSQLFWPEKTIM